MIRRILFAIFALLFLAAGYHIARLRYDPEMHLQFHQAGILSFCELDEIDRLHLCPEVRVNQELVTGGVLTLYRCNPKEGYVETISLSELSKANVRTQLAELPGIYEKVCDTKWGEVFHVMIGARIHK